MNRLRRQPAILGDSRRKHDDGEGDLMNITRRYKTVAVLGLALVGLVSLALAQESVRVEEIRKNLDAYLNEVVTVEGVVLQLQESGKASTIFYQLRDDYGYPIKVRTTNQSPVVGSRYAVTGPVGVDPADHNDIYISEESRTLASPAAATPPPPPVVDVSGDRNIEDPGDDDDSTLGALGGDMILPLLIAVVVVLAVLILLLIVLARMRRRAPAVSEPSTTAREEEAKPEPKVIEGQTIKIHSPPPGTLKILPGRLEIVSGEDSVKEIRFYRVGSQSVPEITFGRAPGPPYTHVQFKQMTVSSRQAKMTLQNNSWLLVNFAPDTSNPTKHNGVELPVDGQAQLNEGDRIEMGEVAFAFHRG